MHCSGGDLRRRLGIDEAALGSLDHQRGQDPGTVSAGIDSDAVRPLLDVRADGVTVDYDEAMVGLVEQKRLADPPQVRLRLLFELNAWTNAGVNEQIIAEATGIDKIVQKHHVVRRYGLPDHRQQLLVRGAGQRTGIYAVAFNTLDPAEPQPTGN